VFALALIWADTLVCPYDFTPILPWNDWGRRAHAMRPYISEDTLICHRGSTPLNSPLVNDLLFLLLSGLEYNIGFGLAFQPLVERGEFVRLNGDR